MENSNENKTKTILSELTEIVKDLNIPKQIIDKSSHLLSSLFGPAVDELGELFRDKVKMWRISNQVKMLSKAFDIIEKKNYKAKVLPAKTLFPLLEYSSLEDNEYMQERWANLLASAANPSNKFNSFNIYIDILHNLSKDELELLELMYDSLNNSEPMDSKIYADYGYELAPPSFSLVKLNSEINIDDSVFEILIGNLIRLNLIEYLFIVDRGMIGIISSMDSKAHIRETSSVKFTPLGLAFIKAVYNA